MKLKHNKPQNQKPNFALRAPEKSKVLTYGDLMEAQKQIDDAVNASIEKAKKDISDSTTESMIAIFMYAFLTRTKVLQNWISAQTLWIRVQALVNDIILKETSIDAIKETLLKDYKIKITQKEVICGIDTCPVCGKEFKMKKYKSSCYCTACTTVLAYQKRTARAEEKRKARAAEKAAEKAKVEKQKARNANYVKAKSENPKLSYGEWASAYDKEYWEKENERRMRENETIKR